MMSEYRNEYQNGNQGSRKFLSRLKKSKRTGVMRKEAYVFYARKKWGDFIKGEWGRVDYMILDHNEDPLIVIEFKSTRARIHKEYGVPQLERYVTTSKARFGILANSINPTQWIYYERSGQKIERISRNKFESIIF